VEPIHRPEDVGGERIGPATIVGRVLPGVDSTRLVVPQLALQARNPSSDEDPERFDPILDEVERLRDRRRGDRDMARQRGRPQNAGSEESGVLKLAVRAVDHQIPAAGELWRTRLLEDHGADPEQPGHRGDPRAEAGGEHGASHRLHRERPQCDPQRHPDLHGGPSLNRPLRMASWTVARSARDALWVTSTIVVPSA